VKTLVEGNPPLLPSPKLWDFISTDTENLAGQRLKDYEDGIDGLVCAYVGYYYWHWKLARTEIFGDLRTGYIVNPQNIFPVCLVIVK
jgi:predicted RNase H-like nuclease